MVTVVARQSVYAVVTGTLERLFQESQTQSSPAVPVRPGPPPATPTEQKIDPMKEVSVAMVTVVMATVAMVIVAMVTASSSLV